jgi:hypothetical protein
MCFVWFSHRSLHETHNKQNKGEDRGMIVSWYLVGLYMLKKSYCE